MGAGAAKPGTPAVGGKGAAQPSRPTLAPAQGASIPAQGGKTVGPQNTLQPGSQIFGGTVTPNTIGPNGLPVGGTMPAGYTSPIPAQGGKAQNPDGTRTGTLPGYAQPYVNDLFSQQAQVQQRAPGQVPAQGGKGTSQQDYDRMMAQSSFSGAPPTYEEFVQNRLNPKPMPQVMPQKPGVPSQLGLNLGSMLYGGGGQQPTTTATPSNNPYFDANLEANRVPFKRYEDTQIQQPYDDTQIQQPAPSNVVPGIGLADIMQRATQADAPLLGSQLLGSQYLTPEQRQAAQQEMMQNMNRPGARMELPFDPVTKRFYNPNDTQTQPPAPVIPRNALNANIPMQELIQGQNTPLAPNPTRFVTPLRPAMPAPVMPAPVAKPGIAGVAQRVAQMRAQQQAAKGRR
jgi:hypothetical protein